MTRRTLAVRTDNVGDVVLTGPAIRALAREAEVTFLAAPRGAEVAGMLPGVAKVIAHDLPWIAADPDPVEWRALRRLIRRLRRSRFDDAVVFTSFHQSPLPTALLLRAAGVGRIGAVSVDFPGSLLDLRHQVADDVHEVERNLSLVRAFGYRTPDPDGDRLRLREVSRGVTVADVEPPYVVVHPGASATARTWSAAGFAATVRALARRGRRVVVTGGLDERALTHRVVGDTPGAVDLAGRTDLAGMVALLRRADCLVVGNTGPAHLAAAVGTPVVSIFPPTVPAPRWRPWGVETVVLGDQDAPCAGCRCRRCPVSHLCLRNVSVSDVVGGVEALRPSRRTSTAAAGR
jgi:ADP-heptose:LPS heptosyltransferase